MKFKIVMCRPRTPPENPFIKNLITETTPTRTAVIEAPSADDVRAFFADAKVRDLPSVRGFELVSVTQIKREDSRCAS